MGQVLQAGQGQIPSRQAQIKARHPEGGLLRDDQQGLRVGHPRRRACSTRRSAPATSRSASAAAWSRCRNAPVPAPAGPLRLPHGRRQGARRDDPRRPAPTRSRGKQMARGGDRGRRRARDDPRRPGHVGAALARARDRGDRRRPPARGDRAGHDPVARRATRSSRSTRRRAARRTLEALAKLPGRSSARTARTRPATRPASTTAPARSCVASDEWAKRNGKQVLATIVAQAAGRRRLRLPRPHARQRGQARRSRRPA